MKGNLGLSAATVVLTAFSALGGCAYEDYALDRPAQTAQIAENPVIAPPPATSETPRPPKPPSAPRTERAAAVPTSSPERPLVTIRFDQPDVDYAQSLYEAATQALKRKPSATFTIEAVAPAAGTPDQLVSNLQSSRQNAQNVLQSLTEMGMPADRLSLAAKTTDQVAGNEVRIYVH